MDEFQNNFKFNLPVELSKGSDGAYRIKGLASTGSVDRQGEVLDVNGFDLSHIDAGKGLLNFDHKNDPENLVGHISGYSKTKEGLFITGELFKGHKKAEDIWSVMQGLNKAGKSRWGLSVEGTVCERDSKNPKRIRKAKIKNVAITLNPVNSDTYVDLAKSRSAELEQEELIKSLVDSDALEFDTQEAPQETAPTTFTASQVIELLQKALSVGAEAATTLPQNISGGASLAKEDLDKEPKNQAKPSKKKKLKKMDSTMYKSMTLEVLEKLKTLYPETPSQTLWEIVKDRLNYTFIENN